MAGIDYEAPLVVDEFTYGEMVPAVERVLERYASLRSDPWVLYRMVRFDDEAMAEPLGLGPSSLLRRLHYAAVYALALGADDDVNEIVKQIPAVAESYGLPDLVPEILDGIERARRGEFLRMREGGLPPSEGN